MCPVKNIEIKQDKPAWRHHCESCLACLHWCPQQAIHGGTESNIEGYRYHHPEIKIDDMIKEKRFIVLNVPALFPDGKKKTVHPVFLIDNEEVIFADSGFPGRIERFGEALSSIGLLPGRSCMKLYGTGSQKDGDELPLFGGIIIIRGPEGRYCLYLKRYKTLIAGDSLSTDGKILCRNSRTAPDLLKILAGFEIQTIVCYYGGICRNDVNRQIRSLAGY